MRIVKRINVTAFCSVSYINFDCTFVNEGKDVASARFRSRISLTMKILVKRKYVCVREG